MTVAAAETHVRQQEPLEAPPAAKASTPESAFKGTKGRADTWQPPRIST